MKYPTFKIRGIPTPYDKLIVCETCHRAKWTSHSTGRIDRCCGRRVREATPQEYEAGKAALEVVI